MRFMFLFYLYMVIMTINKNSPAEKARLFYFVNYLTYQKKQIY